MQLEAWFFMNFLIRQLWNEFEETGDRQLLAEALTHVDISDPFGDSANVKKKPNYPPISLIFCDI